MPRFVPDVKPIASSFSFQVLGREVYTSNNQLGGIQIMHNNGVTHNTVCDDFEGVFTILQWLSYMPKVKLFLKKILHPILCFSFWELLCVFWTMKNNVKMIFKKKNLKNLSIYLFSVNTVQCPSSVPRILLTGQWILCQPRLPMTHAGCWQVVLARVSLLTLWLCCEFKRQYIWHYFFCWNWSYSCSCKINFWPSFLIIQL